MNGLLAREALRFENGVLVLDGAHALGEGRDGAWLYDEVLRIERAHGRGPLRVLVDLRGVPSTALSDRTIAYERGAEWTSRRVAVLGESVFQEFVINFLVAATGHRRSRYFVDETAAWAWLREEPLAT